MLSLTALVVAAVPLAPVVDTTTPPPDPRATAARVGVVAGLATGPSLGLVLEHRLVGELFLIGTAQGRVVDAERFAVDQREVALAAMGTGGVRWVAASSGAVDLALTGLLDAGLSYHETVEGATLLSGASGDLAAAGMVGAALGAGVDVWLSPSLALRAQTRLVGVDANFGDPARPAVLALSALTSPEVGIVIAW